jgi:hypothetical protein
MWDEETPGVRRRGELAAFGDGDKFVDAFPAIVSLIIPVWQ